MCANRVFADSKQDSDKQGGEVNTDPNREKGRKTGERDENTTM